MLIPDKLRIVTGQEIIKLSSNILFVYFNKTTGDIYIYICYLQTGQIKCKSLSK